jgi:peptidoglycan/LPS O-acetylase OafA/YrhL
MRPVKQAGVVSTHVLLYFAPVSAGFASGAALMLLHVSREAFFFISACMLTYAYTDLRRDGLRRFYQRRFVSVGIPYLCWTVIYFFFLMPTAHFSSPLAAVEHLIYFLEVGYYQLYFLLVILQFYLVFPLVLMLLRRTRGHHGLVLAGAVVIQIAVSACIHWNLVPSPVFGDWSPHMATSYVLYLAGGAITAFHLPDVDRWVRRHAWLVVTLTVAAGAAAELWYFRTGSDDPLQPAVIPFNVGAIGCAYLAGVWLVRSRRLRPLVRSGSDNSYGIYLTQMLFITTLWWLGWQNLSQPVPWPVLCLVTAAMVYLSGWALSALLARTPLAIPLTGRKRAPLSWRRRRAAAPVPARLLPATPVPAASVPATPVPAASTARPAYLNGG